MPTPERDLAEAAERYLRSLGREEQERLTDDSIELRGPAGLQAKLTGRKLLGENTLILVFICVIAYLGYVHHIANEEGLRRVYEALVENTYVLSLSQSERERLNVAMPESLRRKLKRE